MVSSSLHLRGGGEQVPGGDGQALVAALAGVLVLDVD